MSKGAKGTLVIIGGAERKDDERTVLKVVADRIRANQRLLIVTAASYEPDGTAKDYIRIFKELGVSEIDVADVRTREDAERQDLVEKCERASAIFFTGGDQLRITSQMGDSPMYQCMKQRYEDGAMIIGTSAGAAAMPFTMIVGGPSDESNRVSALSMAPGLGLLDYVVIDSHFAQRGRMGRLIGAVMQNPRNLGLGHRRGDGDRRREGPNASTSSGRAPYMWWTAPRFPTPACPRITPRASSPYTTCGCTCWARATATT